MADGHRKAGLGRQPGQLSLPHADPAAAVVTRRFDLDDDSAINGRPMDMGRIDQTVPLDTTELWEVVNRSGNLHTFHVHGVQFQVVEQAGAPPPTLAGWKDSVFIPPASTTRLLVRFTDHTDPALPYMFHCHLLEHEDNGMMGQFVVVQPDQAPTKPRPASHRISTAHDPVVLTKSSTPLRGSSASSSANSPMGKLFR